MRATAQRRALFFLLSDALLSLVSLYGAYLLRFNFHIPFKYLEHFWLIFFVLLGFKIAAMAWKHQYRIVWRFFGLGDAKRLLEAHILAYALFALILLLFRESFMPFARSIFIIDFFLSFLMLSSLRISKRLLMEMSMEGGYKPTLIVGVGEGVSSLLRILHAKRKEYKPEAIIALEKAGMVGNLIDNIRIHSSEEMEELIRSRRIVSVLVAEELGQKELNRLIERLESLGVQEIKRFRLLQDGKERLEEISIEELLARRPKDLDKEAIEGFVKQKRILVTGAGGSIGSEICRQCLAFGAQEILAVDSGEYNLYRLVEELGEAKLRPKLLSILDRKKFFALCQEFSPDLLIHAAAYKHVPLCEKNPDTAIENNILGTMNVLDAAIASGVKKLVNISSDKAVRPTNVMGATKRVAELYAQNVESVETEIVSVRFGNVLGSSGSVVPKFKAQIEAGGPVTVTHPEMTRYFMLIPEACQLVLQAAAIAKGGELFILDMGEPVKIADLARKMIRLYGKEGEVEIAFSGLRPGEKLYEELLIDEAECKTKYESIYVAKRSEYSLKELRRDIEELIRRKEKRTFLKKIVPEYTPLTSLR